MSSASRLAAQAALAAVYTDVRICLVDDLVDLKELVERKPDLVFLGMKYLPRNPALGRQDDKRIWLSQFLDEHGIAYTGSATAAHAIEEDKPQAKHLAQSSGLATADFFVVKRSDNPADSEHQLAYPLFVKPTDRGGGMGVDDASLARNQKELASKIIQISGLRSDSLVEQYLPGREFSVAILKNEVSGELEVMPIEISAPPNANGERILGHAIKTADHEQVLSVIDDDLKQQLCVLAQGIFLAIGGRDYGRIDIRLSAEGVPNFLEANLLPSLIDGYGNFPKACVLNINLSYPDMLAQIVRLGLARQQDDVMLDMPVALKQAI